MNALDSMAFSYRLIFSTGDLAAWLWSLALLLFSWFAIGLYWGFMWNRKWTLINHLHGAVPSALIGLGLLAAVLAWFGADRSVGWIEAQRGSLTQQLASSGTSNREALRSAWDKLQPLGGQENLLPPAEGGNELRLTSDDDARVLATAASEAVRRPLLEQGPFTWGAPCMVRDAATVGSEVVDAVPRPKYPVVVSPSNEWSRAAVTAQVGTALDFAAKALAPQTRSLKTLLVGLIVLLLLFHCFLIPMLALRDIRENPKV